MGADHGTIIKLDQARGMNKALQKMCDIACKEAGDTSGKTLVIAHCNNASRAEAVKSEMEKRGTFKRVVITETAGVAWFMPVTVELSWHYNIIKDRDKIKLNL